MPVLRPRPGESDGGYAVADYDEVDPRLGAMADLTALAHDLHERGMALCVDLVLNHTAREHAWAQAALAGDARYRAFYLTFPDRTLPDAYEQTVPDIFPALAPGSFTHVAELDAWVWTTFREFQWDLDYANPDVFRAMVNVLLRLANRGADVLRLDAVPFLWKELGTDCQNRPQAHRLLEGVPRRRRDRRAGRAAQGRGDGAPGRAAHLPGGARRRHAAGVPYRLRQPADGHALVDAGHGIE